jgi:hypothetical protein
MIPFVKQLGFSSPAIPESKGRNMERIPCACFSQSLQQGNNFILPVIPDHKAYGIVREQLYLASTGVVEDK